MENENKTVSVHYEINYSHHGLEYKPITLTNDVAAADLARKLRAENTNTKVTLTKVTITTENVEF